MKTATASILLVVGGYLASLVAAAVTIVAIVAVMSPRGCASYSHTLAVLWAALAALFCVSTTAVGVAAGRIGHGAAARMAVIAVYAVVLLTTYALASLGLMLAFNC